MANDTEHNKLAVKMSSVTEQVLDVFIKVTEKNTEITFFNLIYVLKNAGGETILTGGYKM